MIEYIAILIIGFIGGIPLAMIFVQAGLPLIGFLVWFSLFGYAIWAVYDIWRFRYDRL